MESLQKNTLKTIEVLDDGVYLCDNQSSRECTPKSNISSEDDEISNLNISDKIENNNIVEITDDKNTTEIHNNSNKVKSKPTIKRYNWEEVENISQLKNNNNLISVLNFKLFFVAFCHHLIFGGGI